MSEAASTPPALLITPQSDGSWRVEVINSRSAPADPVAQSAEQWLTSAELAACTGVGSTTWEALAKAGKVRHLRVGKALRFLESEARADMRA